MDIRTLMSAAGTLLLVLFLACSSDDGDPSDDDDVADNDGSSDCGVDPMEMGLNHRPAAIDCPQERAAIVEVHSDCGSSEDDECDAHDDCTGGSNGRCVTNWETGLCSCHYDECFSDDECDANRLCACAEQGPFILHANNSCIHAECRLDTDCATGYCLAAPFHCGSAHQGEPTFHYDYVCATDEDECRNDEICYCENENWRCNPEQSGKWSCSLNYSATCE